MKLFLKNCMMTAFCLSSFASPVSAQFHFKSCDVEPATQPIEQKSYKACVQHMTQTEPPYEWVNPRKKKKARKQEPLPPQRKLVAYGQGPDSLVDAWIHPVLYAATRAYGEHRPMVLSPDMIWLMIAQGFAQHVELHSEQLRPYLVDFQGKQHINVSDSELPPNWNWDDAFPLFSEKISRYVGKELGGALDANFSTSTPATQAAFRITLMDAVSEYFDFSMTVMCGIPEITLEGTPEDWALLEEKTRTLSKYELAWWTDDLAPVLHQLTETSKGRPDLNFWNEMYKIREQDVVCSRIKYMNGWLLRFFPYINGERNPYIGGVKLDFDVKPEGLGDGRSKVDFLLDNNGRMQKMEFMAGFVGISQDPQTLAIRPEITWAVVDTEEAPDKAMLESYQKFQEERAAGEARH